ncbi:MAG TPA: thiamine pyrophosphate-dependent enzyme [Gammaproteobacteria bacterium]|jgi:acetolactate synthase-1/2/3 large subunit|nr:thiamine pyrophosphate-dependent enzyme [Gammaproteobacteria bacterium]
MKKPEYGSDLMVDILKQHEIDYVAFNPGASFRGLHDSIVNYRQDLPWILCCHEEISIAIAHGYAKASGKYMAVFIHSNIGLQHASMAIFNAWCDRVPILIIGGVGPLDTTKRRPWIDWIHTSLNQDNIIRDYVKWCDQPFSLPAVPEALYRACKILNTEPKAPVYIAIDSTLQEEKIDYAIEMDYVENYLPPEAPTASKDSLVKLAELLIQAEFPLIITDYTGRNPDAVNHLIKLAELLNIPVIDQGGRYNFPNIHPLCLTGVESDIYKNADVILALDVHDLCGALGALKNGTYFSHIHSNTKVVHVTLSDYLIGSWAADYHKLYPTYFSISADSYQVICDLIEYCIDKNSSKKNPTRFDAIQSQHVALRKKWQAIASDKNHENPLAVQSVLKEIWQNIREEDWMLTNNGGVETGKWVKKLWEFSEVGQYIGESGGAGLGYGLGASIGAALAHKDSGKLCINLQSDGDFLFTPSALWTAAHHQIPLLIIMMNNYSYGNSKEHAVVMAKERQREVSNAHCGTSISHPEVDFAAMAKSQGVFALDAIKTIPDLTSALKQAIMYIKKEKKPVLLDVIIQ